MRKLAVVSLLILFLSGCATMYTSMNHRLYSLPPGCSLEQIQKKVGNPIKKEYITTDITRLTYNSFHWGELEDRKFWVYLRDNQLIRVSEEGYPFGAFTELNDLLAIGAISREEYEWRHQQLAQRANIASQYLQAMSAQPSYQIPSYRPSSQKQQKRCYTSCSPSIHGDVTSGANCITTCY